MRRAIAFLLLFVGVASYAEAPRGRTIYNPMSSLKGGTTFQVAPARGASNRTMMFNVGANSAVTFTTATRPISYGEPSDKDVVPATGTVGFTAINTACIASDSATIPNTSTCNQYTLPAGAYESTGITMPGGTTTGYYHRVVGIGSSCPSFDPSDTTGWTFDTVGTTITYPGTGKTLANTIICTQFVGRNGSGEMIAAATLMAETAAPLVGSKCLYSINPGDCP
jgi:hypothetical protein